MIQKMMIEKAVYILDGREYENGRSLRWTLKERMGELFCEMIDHAKKKSGTRRGTQTIDTLKKNIARGDHTNVIFTGDRMFDLFEQIEELKSIYSQLDD
mgnify:CR=1 FL=1